MASLGTAELTLQERGILATSAYAAYLDDLSSADRFPATVSEQPVPVKQSRSYHSRGQVHKIEWQDFGQPLPAWFDPLMQGFVDLLTLPLNWDSYGAGAIDMKVIQEAMSFTHGLLGPASPSPRVVPLSSGGLQLEWHRNGIDLEIVFDLRETPFFYCRKRSNGKEFEQPLPENSALLRSIIDEFE